ncbi:transposase [Chryseobacterium herbae]|uniref:Transposase n=1 Tax=Chryseobacterium herbae TaxID=2976476 RepID=A0ABT2ITC2_9FLAO|nr:transposase [Chryseobacterium sp. pc1-10]MCT2562079.1 transposase [Chryseobacterium sp. pc1-10]
MTDPSLKKIHIGLYIEQRVEECEMELSRVCNFLKCSAEEVKQIYDSENLNSEVLLKLSKLLEYDFFRLYSQHLIMYAPSSKSFSLPKTTNLPRFRKNIYTKEIIEFILELISNGNKTPNQIIEEYDIPKTTVHNWLKKYKHDKTAQLQKNL